jgi:2',3'-cyclic-nucleotide 2'-phosphodiesterase (5'-nucleotidase family)
VVNVVYGTAENHPSAPADPAVLTLMAKWQAKTDAELNQVVGYLEKLLPRKGLEQQKLITASWLWAYPTADVALTNMGGFRADIPAGELTLGNLITVFPFNNVLVELQLTGRELEQLLDERHRDLATAGVYASGGQWYSQETGQPLESETMYTVLVNDFMYAGGDEFTQLAQFDPAGYNTAIDWRQPLIDWLSTQKSTADAPLDPLIQQLTP